MRSIFAFEIKKLIRNRLFLLLFALFLVFDVAVCLYSGTEMSEEELAYAEDAQKLYAEGGYEDTVSGVIRSAEASLKSNIASGFDENGYICRYQKQVISTYTENLGVSVSSERVSGWQELITFRYDFILSSLLVLLIVPTILLYDDSHGMRGMIRASKNGRRNVFAARMTVLFAASAVTELIFFLAAFSTVALSVGFGPFSASVQSIMSFALCPFRTSVLGAALIMLGMKTLSLLMIFVFTSVLSCILKNAVAALVGSSAFCAVGYLAAGASYTSLNAFFRVINIFSLSDGSLFMQRLYGIRIFTHSVNAVAVSLCLLCLMLLLLPIAYLVYARSGRPKLFDLPKPKLKKSMHRTVVGFELKKLLSGGTAVMILLICACKVGYTCFSYENPGNDDVIYKSYMEKLAGPMTDEKKQFIVRERSRIGDIIAQKEINDAMFDADMMSGDEYNAYLDEYYLCIAQQRVFPRVEARAQYIESSESGAWFVYDTGYNILLGGEADLFCLLLIIVLCCGSFSREYSTGMVMLLSSSENGRERLSAAKLCCCVTLSLLLFALLALFDFVFLSGKTVFPLWNAPASSLPFLASAGGLTLKGFLALSLFARALSFAFAAAAVQFLSKTAKRGFFALILALAACVLPHAAYLLGLTFAGYVSLPLLLSAGGYASEFGMTAYVCALALEAILMLPLLRYLTSGKA